MSDAPFTTQRTELSGRRLRLELQGPNGFEAQDAQVVVSKGSFWVYDPTANTVYKGTLPRHNASEKPSKHEIPSLARIQRAIGMVLAPHWSGMSIETYVDRVEKALADGGGPAG